MKMFQRELSSTGKKNHNNIKAGTICPTVTKPAKRLQRPLFVTLGTPRKKQRGRYKRANLI